ncbi:MFS transporter [Fodinicola acaciae]|uniref:MFS transporter n=1 Tax=Fodinicola acaciae TaxID=2681555 RepID=UPI0013D4CCA1|nr:MFS transporter [Fodinicola acaciae]
MPGSAARQWLALAGVSVLSFLGCVDLTIVNTAAPRIGTDLGANVEQLQLIVNVFVVALSMAMVAAGRLADTYGRHRVLYAGAVLFGLASLGAGLAPTIPALIACRFVQGLSCAALYTTSSTLVAEAFPESRRGRAVGALFAVNGAGLAIGPLLGGLIVAVLDWHWIFLLNVPLVIVALGLCATRLRESERHQRSLDWPGLALLATGVCGLIFALTFHDLLGWSSWPVLTALVTGGAAIIAFVVVEWRHRDPLIPPRLLRHPLLRAAMTAELGLAFFYTTVLFLLPLYLTTVRGYGPAAVGLLMLPITLTVAVLSPITGRFVDRFGPLAVILVGFAAFTLSAVLLGGLAADSPIGYLVAAGVPMGIGWACVLGPSATAAMLSVAGDQTGLAVGATWTVHNVGGAIGLAVSLSVFRLFGGSFVAAMLLLAVVACAAFATIATIAWRSRSRA